MASVSSCVSSSISEKFSENSIDQKIKHFFSLSKNLNLQEKAEGGKEYQLLSKLFAEGFEINESRPIRGRGLVDQSWPEILREEIGISFLGTTLLDYLKEAESYLERFWSVNDITLEQISEIESYLPSTRSSYELNEASTLMTKVVRMIKPEKGVVSQRKCHAFYISAERTPEFLSTKFASLPLLKEDGFFSDPSSFKVEGSNSSLNSFSQLNSSNSDQKEL